MNGPGIDKKKCVPCLCCVFQLIQCGFGASPLSFTREI